MARAKKDPAQKPRKPRQPKKAVPAPSPAPIEAPPKRKPGRPSKYDPAFCELVVELGEMGKSLTQMASRIGVLKETMMDWTKVHPEFSAAVSMAVQLSQSWWEDAGQSGLAMGRDFNAVAFQFQMKNRFRADYTDKVEVKHDGAVAFNNIWQMIGQGKVDGVSA